MPILRKILIFASISLILGGCGVYKKTDARNIPTKGQDRARKNVDEGRGISLKNLGGRGKTTYEFSSSNPMWRASLEILDFLPLTTVDYSGGMIISDWYSDTSNQKESIKITIRFLSNDIQTGSLKILVHKKTCIAPNNCLVKKIKSKIEEELQRSILSKAALIEKEDKKNKK
tara:strand:+ start:744 stop:1262 length:519 start_codon:yes stop_codon:yes gene_type:complete